METPSNVEPDNHTVLQPVDPGPTPPSEAPPAVPQEVRRIYKGTGLVWALIAALVGAILLVILVAQNTASVTIHFLWFAPDVSLVVLVLAFVLLAVCVTESIGLVWRHRRRQRLTQQDELRRIQSTENWPIPGRCHQVAVCSTQEGRHTVDSTTHGRTPGSPGEHENVLSFVTAPQ
ncbi:MAG: hypothetical protein WCI74_03180 [Actinomycetes bacterium]